MVDCEALLELPTVFETETARSMPSIMGRPPREFQAEWLQSDVTVDVGRGVLSRVGYIPLEALKVARRCRQVAVIYERRYLLD